MGLRVRPRTTNGVVRRRITELRLARPELVTSPHKLFEYLLSPMWRSIDASLLSIRRSSAVSETASALVGVMAWPARNPAEPERRCAQGDGGKRPGLEHSALLSDRGGARAVRRE